MCGKCGKEASFPLLFLNFISYYESSRIAHLVVIRNINVATSESGVQNF